MISRCNACCYLYQLAPLHCPVLFSHPQITLCEHCVVTWYPLSVLLVTIHVVMKLGWFEVAALAAASVVSAKVCFTMPYGAILPIESVL